MHAVVKIQGSGHSVSSATHTCGLHVQQSKQPPCTAGTAGTRGPLLQTCQTCRLHSHRHEAQQPVLGSLVPLQVTCIAGAERVPCSTLYYARQALVGGAGRQRGQVCIGGQAAMCASWVAQGRWMLRQLGAALCHALQGTAALCRASQYMPGRTQA